MLNFQWPVWESESDNTKFNTPAPHSHLRPCNTNKSHDTREKMANWAQFGHFHSGVLTLVTSSLDLNGCVLSYFEGTANLHCYTNCTLATLHCSKVSFFQCCHMKIYNKIFIEIWGYTHFCEILYVLQYKKYILMCLNIFNWLGRHCWECPQKHHIHFCCGGKQNHSN